jgi:uncharacterized protein (TIRG00374 family)
MKQLLHILKYVLVVGIVFYIVQNNGGMEILRTMSSARPEWIVLAFIFFLGSVFLVALQWKILLNIQGVFLSTWSAFSMYHLGLFYNAIVVNIAGDAMRVYKMKKAGISITASSTATFMDRYLGFCALALIALLSSTIIWYQNMLQKEAVLWMLGVSASVFGALCVGSVILLSKRLNKLVLFALASLYKLRLGWLHKTYNQLHSCMSLHRDRLTQLGVLILFSVLIQGLRIVGAIICAYALNLDISPLYFFAVIPIVSFSLLIPLNVGGWGVTQGVSISLYSIPGVIGGMPNQEAIAIAAGSITFLPSILFYINMLLGGIFISSKPRVVEDT